MIKEEFYNEMESMPLEEKKGYLEDRLRWLIQSAYQNAPAVRENIDRAKVHPSQIKTIKDLERIPITKKDDLVELQKARPPFAQMITVAPGELRRIYISPGPIYDPHGYTEHQRTVAGAKGHYAAGFRKGDIGIITASYHLVPAGTCIEEAYEALGVTVIPAGTGNTELQVQVMHDLKVTCFDGTPSFLMTLIKKAEELGYDFRKDFALRHAYVSAEPLPESLRQSFEQDYGITITQGYGIAELPNLAYECSFKSGMHIDDELALIEIVDPVTGRQLPPGEVGEIVITAFDKVYPLVRFSTGDLSSLIDETCPCGRTSSRLTGIVGRVGDTTKVRGMFIRKQQVDEVLSRFPQVSKGQLILERIGVRDRTTIRLELKGKDINRQELEAEVSETFRDVCRLKLDEVEFVDTGTIPEKHKKIEDTRRWE